MIQFRVFLRPLVFVSLLLLSMAGAACGGGGHHHEGTLEVVNDFVSTDVVEEIDLDDVFSPWFATFFVDLFPGEAFAVDLWPSAYDVTIFWASGAVEFHTVDVFDHTTTTLVVAN